MTSCASLEPVNLVAISKLAQKHQHAKRSRKSPDTQANNANRPEDWFDANDASSVVNFFGRAGRRRETLGY